jgi:hypothetical protein
LAGLSLSDDLLQPQKFVFPAETVVPAGGWLLVWCSANSTLPGLRTGFALRSEGGNLWLFGPAMGGGLVQVDHVEYGLQIADRSIGRLADGVGAWQLNLPTPGAANQVQPLGSAGALKINEWMARPASGADWFELFNPELLPVAVGGFSLTDDLSIPTISPIPPLSFLDGWSFQKMIADEDPASGADHVRFKLAREGDEIGLYDAAEEKIDSVHFGGQTSGVSEGRLPDGGAWPVSFAGGGTPGRSNRGDADGDRLPDDWESAHRLSALLAADAAWDSDGDGLTNLEEFWAGTDPQEGRSCLQIDSVEWNGGVLKVRFTAVAGKVYAVQYRDGLEGAWADLERIESGAVTREVEVVDLNASGTQIRFYRLVLKRG